jgi:hypothetical protein
MEKLSEILSYAEGLNMPEGDYLKVANALKEVFNKKEEEKEVADVVIEKPEDIIIEIYSEINNITYTIEVVSKRKRISRGNVVKTNEALVYYKNGKEKIVYTDVEFDENTYLTNYNKMNSLLRRLEATMVRIVKDDITYNYGIKETCRKCFEFAKKNKTILDDCIGDNDESEYDSDMYEPFLMIGDVFDVRDRYYDYIERRISDLVGYYW